MSVYKDVYERVAKLNDIVIVSPEFKNAFIGIQECASRSQSYKEPIGTILKSAGGLGKTTLCRSIIHQMPKSIKQMDGYEKTVIPAFYVEVPSPTTVKSLASTMLNRLGDPTPMKGTTAQLTVRLIYLLRQCETILVFLDEFHHLFDRKSASTQLNVTVGNWLKTLVNETGISFCLVGLPEFVDFLEVDSQIARRFQYRYELNSLSLGDTACPGTIYPFLRQIAIKTEERVKVTFDLPLDSPLSALQIYASTKGYHSYVMLLITESIAIALIDSRDVVNTQDFSQAWQLGITSFIRPVKQNPFQMSMSQIAAALREKM